MVLLDRIDTWRLKRSPTYFAPRPMAAPPFDRWRRSRRVSDGRTEPSSPARQAMMSSARSKVILGLTQALQILAADDHASVSETSLPLRQHHRGGAYRDRGAQQLPSGPAWGASMSTRAPADCIAWCGERSYHELRWPRCPAPSRSAHVTAATRTRSHASRGTC